MNIELNGKSFEIAENELLADLIARLNLDGPVAAQVNEEIIHKDQLAKITLKPSDKVELLRMMGGG